MEDPGRGLDLSRQSHGPARGPGRDHLLVRDAAVEPRFKTLELPWMPVKGRYWAFRSRDDIHMLRSCRNEYACNAM